MPSLPPPASSAPPLPLKRIAHPTTHSLTILPRRPSPAGTYDKRAYPLDAPTLRASDTFRLTLSAFGDTFHLHLRPNEHLVHPAARVKVYKTGADGRTVLDRTEPLLQENVRAYWGEVVSEEGTEERMREDAAGVARYGLGSGNVEEEGWARIVVHEQGDAESGVEPRFEGAFEVRGMVYHVMTRESYERSRMESATSGCCFSVFLSMS